MCEFITRDVWGNAIIVKGTHITLKVSSSNPKLLAIIDRDSQSLVMTRDRSRHMMHKNHSYGFNHHLLATAEKCKKIHLTDQFGVYIIPIEVILKEGSYLHFKKEGFERQLFLPIERIEEFKVHEKTY